MGVLYASDMYSCVQVGRAYENRSLGLKRSFPSILVLTAGILNKANMGRNRGQRLSNLDLSQSRILMYSMPVMAGAGALYSGRPQQVQGVVDKAVQRKRRDS